MKYQEQVNTGEGFARSSSARDRRPAACQGTVPPTAVRQPGRYERRFKPVLDLGLASILLLVVLPLLALSALAVFLTLGRPVILRQERVGLHGQIFTIYKFRTMEPCRRGQADRRVEGASRLVVDRARNGTDRRLRHKDPGDPRLVPVGRFLRRWSLDELPQLYNVVRGEMSLVGPRPEMPEIVRGYETWQHRRHTVRPGLTGLWQVSDRGQDGRLMHQRTDVDLQYVDQLSFLLDVRLLLLTPLAALGLHRGF